MGAREREQVNEIETKVMGFESSNPELEMKVRKIRDLRRERMREGFESIGFFTLPNTKKTKYPEGCCQTCPKFH